MKKLLFKISAFLLVMVFAVSCNETLVPEENPLEPGLKSANGSLKSYVVVLNDAELDVDLISLKGYENRKAAAQKAASKVLKRAGIDGQIGHAYGTALKGFSVKIPPGQLKKLGNDPSVKYIEEDQIISLVQPTARPGDDVQAAAAQVVPYGIGRVLGGATYTGTKVVWVIDSGIDLDHEDLNVDGSRGWNFITNSLNADDDNGHGTHCAGTIAAVDNAVGVVGVAAGATVIPIKVLDRRGSGSTSGVIAGVDFVAANGSDGDVANMSLGGGAYAPLDEAVYNASNQPNKKIYFSLAAGNESDDANSHSPARVNGDYIYTISAMDINDNWAYFSNYGNPPVDFCEPGVSVYSTYKGGAYATMSGTSMAAPHMAGILVWGLPATGGYVNSDPDVTNSTPGYADPIGVVGGGSSNNAPVANAGSDITTTEGELVTLDGTGSYDSDAGDVITYEWTSLDGIVLSDANVKEPTFIAPQVDSETTYTFSLVVNDGKVDSNTDLVNVVVKDSSTPVADITITAVGSKIRGTRYLSVTWSGATGTNVDIKLNGVTQVTTANDGSETINMGRTSGTFVVTVCETNGSACSNGVTVIL